MRNRTFAVSLLLLTLSGCTSAIVWLSKEDASWSFIQTHCQGMQLGKIETSAGQVSIPIAAWDRYDSGVCLYDARGRVTANRIEIVFRKGLCSGNALPGLLARFPKPPLGDYQIVYGDPDAGYPVVGSLHVD